MKLLPRMTLTGLTLALPGLWTEAAPAPQRFELLRYKVGAESVAAISPEIFGQFLERPSWGGESGPEAALAPVRPGAQARLRVDVAERIRELAPRSIRFPGGTDIDYIDWTDMIDHAPGRESAERPVTIGHSGNAVTNRFGYHEYFTLRDELRCSTVLVTNLRDALYKRKPLREAALHAAGLVAYANAPQGRPLPADMPDWPAVRALNGHPEAFRADYVQIGNELYFLWPPKSVDAARLGLETKESQLAWFIECVSAYIRAIREVDPAVPILVDGPAWGPTHFLRAVCEDAYIRSQLGLVSFHTYHPMGLTDARHAGYAALAPRDRWEYLIAGPGDFSPEGLSIGPGWQADYARQLGIKAAITEWNWNGWAAPSSPQIPGEVNIDYPAAIGAAGFLHGLLRQADAIAIAHQSMLVGTTWGITAVRAPHDGSAAYLLPQGHVFRLYSKHHGDHVLRLSGPPVPPYYLKNASGKKPERVSYVDAIATADGQQIYFHIINRSFDHVAPVTVDLSGLGVAPDARATWHLLTGQPETRLADGPITLESSQEMTLVGGFLQADLPSHSVSILTVPFAHGASREAITQK